MRSFRQVHRAMFHLMRVEADTLGLTPVQIMVIHAIKEEPNISLNELADRLQMGCSTVSGVVKRLVEAKILERERVEEDQRTIAMRLTDKGQDLEEQAYGDDSLISQAVLRFLELPDDDLDRLLQIHQRLIDILRGETDRKS
ncbi:MarR family winged helix-turn-helix transcriptional regulator [Alicyclobacillus dauci]|uniref:MarR family transcriptional regulator n=1 Tax=Alicyclobacillus dauci TaxID=1475485 RepID=A0ABY6Z618_9BACL|nr:MarR family transcriptional regulator [Alicyclobacillus dauci]WAH38267.1 MarR family transcriptional regulator [Alicyclobacillus dauci]